MGGLPGVAEKFIENADFEIAVVPEFPVSMIIFGIAVSLIFFTRLIPNLKIGSD